MTKYLRFLLVALMALPLLGWARPAQAHFLWANVEQAPGQTLQLHVRFAEACQDDTALPATRIVKCLAQLPNGQTVPLTVADTQMSGPLPPKAQGATVVINWGVVDSSKQGRGIFLLKYWAQAAANLYEAGKANAAPFQITVQPGPEAGTFLAMLTIDGKAAPNTELTVQSAGAAGPSLYTSDAQGLVTLKALPPGLCGLRFGTANQESGVYEGKAYALLRRYATLTFPVPAK